MQYKNVVTGMVVDELHFMQMDYADKRNYMAVFESVEDGIGEQKKAEDGLEQGEQKQPEEQQFIANEAKKEAVSNAKRKKPLTTDETANDVQGAEA